MIRVRIWIVTFLTLLMMGGVCAARVDAAATADPGFAFIDVNGDGLYNPSDGDIGLGSTPSVDVNALIQSGSFDTQHNKAPNYQAPSWNVSLVIPPSQNFTLKVPLTLQAGNNLVVYGTLQAPAIFLKAGGNVDLTGSSPVFNSEMSLTAGVDAILDGCAPTGLNTGSSFSAFACGNIYANLIPSDGFVTSVLAFGKITFKALNNIFMDQAALTTLDSTSTISVTAKNNITAIDGTGISAGALARVRSTSNNVIFQNGAVGGSPIQIRAAQTVDVTGSSLFSLGAITVQAGKQVIGNSPATALLGAGISVTGHDMVDLSRSALFASANPVSIQSTHSAVSADRISIFGAGGVQTHARNDISAIGAVVQVDHFLTLTSDRGQIDTTNSQVSSATNSATDTAISLTCPGLITADGANWTALVSIDMTSSTSNILARHGMFSATNSGGQINLTAYGLTIDVTGTTFVGTVTYGPSGVNVIGP